MKHKKTASAKNSPELQSEVNQLHIPNVGLLGSRTDISTDQYVNNVIFFNYSKAIVDKISWQQQDP